jgi:hypothetical protein
MAAPSTSANRQKEEPLEARQAVEAALRYFKTLFGSPIPGRAAVSLEEVELSPDRKYWLVTLSHEELRRKLSDLPTFLRVPQQKFKVFKVERKSGRVVSMKMRNGA